MTDRELRKLSRMDLVEMLLTLTRENDRLRQELTEAQQQLESKRITIENAGSLAEAALKLNHVFEAAQAACEQYTENLQTQIASQREICDQMERESREKSEKILEEARMKAEAYLKYVREKVREQYHSKKEVTASGEEENKQ